MVRILKYLKPYWSFAIAAPLFMALEVVMDLAQPMFMQRIIDVGIANGDTTYVWKTLYRMLSVAFVGFAGGISCAYFSAKAAINAGTDIRENVFEHVQNLSFGNVDRLRTGNLITVLTNDIVQVQRMMMMMMRIMVKAPIQLVGSLVMTYIISPRLFMILLVLVPLLGLGMALVVKKGYPLYRMVQSKLDVVNTVMQENLSGIRVVKAFVREDFERERFSKANNDYMDSTVKISRIMAIMLPLIMVLMNLGIVAVLWFGNIEVASGSIQVGKVIAFINYLLQLLISVMMVAGMMMMYSRAQASAERIVEVLETVPDIKDSDSAVPVDKLVGDLIFENVSFSYGDHAIEPVLTDISFTAKPGEKVAIIGSTGSGKSTLVNLISRLYDVSGGRITIGGIDIKEIKTTSLRKQISLVLQQSLLFSGTIGDNIRYGKTDATMTELKESAKVSGAEDFIESFEKGYETVLGQKGVNLSGGQKQRISIARGLIRKPYILILDDSTSAVDVVTEFKIQAALKEMTSSSIVVMVAQRISSVLDADQIIVLEDGKIAGQGNHESLIRGNQVYREIYESQLGKAGEAYGA
ncbi:MAG TPA: ABC transporter ATP-binding protein [Clostridia bacterium]|nr:ABC transporter ATP-binding protein [Clostridia bacterium]